MWLSDLNSGPLIQIIQPDGNSGCEERLCAKEARAPPAAGQMIDFISLHTQGHGRELQLSTCTHYTHWVTLVRPNSLEATQIVRICRSWGLILQLDHWASVEVCVTWILWILQQCRARRRELRYIYIYCTRSARAVPLTRLARFLLIKIMCLQPPWVVSI